jgi:dihydroorotase
VGVKVRMSRPTIGDNDLEPLRRAVAIADATHVPVMMHIGNGPRPLGELLDLLRPGDIVTHCFSGTENAIIEDGRIGGAVMEARRRGILFDVGHGSGSFSFRVAEIAAGLGFWPDSISTDLHSLSANGPVFDLPTTMSKFLFLGMPLEDVIRSVTVGPAAAIGRNDVLGAIALGRVADLSVFHIEQGPRTFVDAHGETRPGSAGVQVRHTIRAGIPWHGPWPHPGRGPGIQPDRRG